MRSFIALKLSSEVHAELDTFVQTLKPAVRDAVRWVRSTNIHLTVKFLGEVDQVKYRRVFDETRRLAQTVPSFQLTISGSGVFPAWDHPRILWVGVQAPLQLSILVDELEKSMTLLGFAPENRPFSPHLTLGRVNSALNNAQRDHLRRLMDQAKSKVFGVVPVRELTIFKSDLRPEGPIYTALATIPFIASTE